MSRTLLYTVQRVLEKLDLDEVNSINDTTDSILVAREAEDTLNDLFNRNEWPERYDLVSIESVSNTQNPTALRIPIDVSKRSSVRCETTESGASDREFCKLTQLSPEDFLDMTYSRRSSDDNVIVADYNGLEILVYNDQAPTYFAVFDNEIIILDSFDNQVEATVQGSKTICRASTFPTFIMNDDYIIPLDLKTYPLYLSELTTACGVALNGDVNVEEERRRNRAISRLRREADRLNTLSSRNNFGRDGTGRS